MTNLPTVEATKFGIDENVVGFNVVVVVIGGIVVDVVSGVVCGASYWLKIDMKIISEKYEICITKLFKTYTIPMLMLGMDGDVKPSTNVDFCVDDRVFTMRDVIGSIRSTGLGVALMRVSRGDDALGINLLLVMKGGTIFGMRLFTKNHKKCHITHRKIKKQISLTQTHAQLSTMKKCQTHALQ